MESVVIIRNRTTKVESEIPAKLWSEKKNTPEWRGVFQLVKSIKEPPEVVALKAKKAAAKKNKLS